MQEEFEIYQAFKHNQSKGLNDELDFSLHQLYDMAIDIPVVSWN